MEIPFRPGQVVLWRKADLGGGTTLALVVTKTYRRVGLTNLDPIIPGALSWAAPGRVTAIPARHEAAQRAECAANISRQAQRLTDEYGIRSLFYLLYLMDCYDKGKAV